MSFLHYQIVYKWFWSEDEKPRGLSHTGKQERVGFAALALCSPWSLKWQVFVLAGWEVEIYSISYSVMLCVTLRKVNYSLPVMYIKNALALLHKTICLCWIYFWNPRTRNFQMRVQPVPLGSQTRTRVLFFQLRLILYAWKNIKYCFSGDLHQMSFVCLTSFLSTVLPCFLGEPHSTEIQFFHYKILRTNSSLTLKLEAP